MNILEKILEEIEKESKLAHEEMRRCIKENYLQFDEAKGYARGCETILEIIRSHMNEREKVSSAEIISRNIDGKPYYEIKYKKIGEDFYHVGYSSYCLDYVLEWLNKYFEFCGESKVIVNNGWILVSERLPEAPRENPIFDNKPLEIYMVDIGERYPLRAFWNGKDFTDGWSKLEVVAWQPLPKPYKGK